MVFTSISFLYYFLPLVLLFYFAVPKKAKNFVLLISSILFYFYGEQKYIFLMFADILIAYIGALLIKKHKRKELLIVFISIPIALLVLFKYTNFIFENINYIFNTNITLSQLILPIGISFYTFQIISYIIDVYRGTVEAQTNFIKFAAYISFFPQLIAGPIVRYESIEKEIENRSHNFKDLSYGIRRFIFGLAKKVLIANILGEFCNIFVTTSDKSIAMYWAFGIGYMLQIFFDFSAYSDMAIGLGKMFGFHFPENFDYPYISRSITEFWRRWHISLSSWFKDYVYIPLGGNRKGSKILIRNVLIVWLLTGIWHGANWNFIIWGLLFGFVLLIEKFLLNKYLNKLPNILRHIYVLFIVMISFILFNGPTIKVAWLNIAGLFGINCKQFINSTTLYYLKSYSITFIIAIICSTPILKNAIGFLKQNNKINKIINIIETLLLPTLLIVVTAYLVDSSYNPFLYFRF